MFIDSSVIVAIIAQEQDADEFASRIEAATRRLTGAHVVLEAAMTLSRILDVDPLDAEAIIIEFIEDAGIEVVAIDLAAARAAVSAFSCYGKGRGKKANLNFGDCLSYACAVRHDAPLLFKGLDFAHTDVLRA